MVGGLILGVMNHVITRDNRQNFSENRFMLETINFLAQNHGFWAAFTSLPMEQARHMIQK
jgi:hypothetical protein